MSSEGEEGEGNVTSSGEMIAGLFAKYGNLLVARKSGGTRVVPTSGKALVNRQRIFDAAIEKILLDQEPSTTNWLDITKFQSEVHNIQNILVKSTKGRGAPRKSKGGNISIEFLYMPNNHQPPTLDGQPNRDFGVDERSVGDFLQIIERDEHTLSDYGLEGEFNATNIELILTPSTRVYDLVLDLAYKAARNYSVSMTKREQKKLLQKERRTGGGVEGERTIYGRQIVQNQRYRPVRSGNLETGTGFGTKTARRGGQQFTSSNRIPPRQTNVSPPRTTTSTRILNEEVPSLQNVRGGEGGGYENLNIPVVEEEPFNPLMIGSPVEREQYGIEEF